MKNKKDKTFLYIVSTITFIVLGIVLTGIINSTKSSDTRTRASATAGIEATAIVATVDSEKQIVVVQNLLFTSSPEKNLGTWVVTPPSGFSFTSITSGTAVRIVIDPKTFAITNKTLTAKEIKKK